MVQRTCLSWPIANDVLRVLIWKRKTHRVFQWLFSATCWLAPPSVTVGRPKTAVNPRDDEKVSRPLWIVLPELSYDIHNLLPLLFRVIRPAERGHDTRDSHEQLAEQIQQLHLAD